MRGAIRPIVRGIVFGCALLAGLVLVFFLWKAKVDRDLDAAWRQALGGASFVERYPKSDDNATVLELERLGAAIGLNMAPIEARERNRPTEEAYWRWRAVPLHDVLAPEAQSEDGALAAPPAAVADFLDFARPTLRRVVEALLRDPPPVWQRDLGLGFESPAPGGLGILNLQKLLLLEAREQIRSGHTEGALAVLEASRRYNEALRTQDPHLLQQLVALAVLNLQQPVLRSLPASNSASAEWRARLDGVAARSSMLVALHYEAFRAHQAAILDRLDLWAPVALPRRFWMRFLLWDHSRRLEAMLQDPVRMSDPGGFNREQLRRLPRWQTVTRDMVTVCCSEVWGKAARAELNADLTARILEERERLASGGPPRAEDRRPSRASGLSWIYEDTPEGTRIYLDGEPAYRHPSPLALRFLVRRPARGSGN